MPLRSKAAIIFMIVFILEIIMYLNYTPLTPPELSGIFEYYLKEMNMVNTRYMIIIFSSVTAGAIIIFAMPNKKE